MVMNESKPADVRNEFRIYTIVPVLSGGTPLPEQKVLAILQKDANSYVWDNLSEGQRNNLEYFDVVDIQYAEPHHFNSSGQCRICNSGICTLGAFKIPCFIGEQRKKELERMFMEDWADAISEEFARNLIRTYWKKHDDEKAAKHLPARERKA